MSLGVDAEGLDSIENRKLIDSQWIAELHAQRRCTEPLHELLDFIEFGMLQPDPKDRSACGQITSEITYLLDRCKREPEYATRGKAGTRNPARFQSSERTAQAVNVCSSP